MGRAASSLLLVVSNNNKVWVPPEAPAPGAGGWGWRILHCTLQLVRWARPAALLHVRDLTTPFALKANVSAVTKKTVVLRRSFVKQPLHMFSVRVSVGFGAVSAASHRLGPHPALLTRQLVGTHSLSTLPELLSC